MAMRSQAGYRAKRRNSGQRKRRKIFWLATEGDNKTETHYFRDMGQALDVCFRFVPGNYTDPVQIASSMEQIFNDNTFDEDDDKAYCLIDADFNSTRNALISKADDIANKYGFRILISAPCFETWLLCHFSASAKQYYSNDEVLRTLQRYLRNYSKNAQGIYAATAALLPEAIKNAKQLERTCQNAGYAPHTTEFQPSTEIYVLIEDILRSHETSQ